MNLENFAEYLKYPSRLYQLPYEELKSLTMQYPYCSNFHVLLLIKSKLEGHPDLEKNLARAATYSVDRKHLRRIMLEETLIPAESQITIGEDEILELKDLFTLDEEWEKLPVETSKTSQEEGTSHLTFDFTGALSNPTDEPKIIDLEIEEGENSESEVIDEPPTESFSEEPDIFSVTEKAPVIPEDAKDHSDLGIPDAAASTEPYPVSYELLADLAAVVNIAQSWALPTLTSPIPDPSIPFQFPEGLTDDCIAVSVVLQDWWEQRENTAILEWEITPVQSKQPVDKDGRKTIAPTPKSKFPSYKKRYRRPLQKDAPLPSPSPVPTAALAPSAKTVAEESLREDLGVASETLASLLVQQHQYERAIKMYEHLSLLIPEKNTYFAAKIDAIKNL